MSNHTIPPLTDEEANAMLRESPLSWIDALKRAYALGAQRTSTPVATVDAARDALTKLADSSDDGSMRGRHVAADALAFRDREYPAPVLREQTTPTRTLAHVVADLANELHRPGHMRSPSHLAELAAEAQRIAEYTQ